MRYRTAKEEVPMSRPATEMPGLFPQFAGYQYEPDKLSSAASAAAATGAGGDSANLDLSFGSRNSTLQSSSLTFNRTSQQQQARGSEMPGEQPAAAAAYGLSPPERDYASQQRENKLQLQQHERDQHLHQLQSINNLLLDLPTPTTPSPPGSYASSKFSSHELLSPTVPAVKSKPQKHEEDMLMNDIFGLRLSRASMMNSNQKEQGPVGGGAQSNYDSLAYQNYPQQREDTGGYYSNLPSSEQQERIRNYYPNNIDVPSSPVSVHTPASPSSPGSLYSNPYSYSSVNSSQYTESSASYNSYGSNGSKPLSSPSSARLQNYGRPIRGCSTPYSHCSSPTTEFSPYVFNYNGSRSDSPADSDNSTNSVDGPLSDIMSYLSMNPAAQRRCLQLQNPSYEGVLKLLQNAQHQQQSQAQHYQQQNAYGPSRNQQQYNAQLLSLPPPPPQPPRNNPSCANHGYGAGKNMVSYGNSRDTNVYPMLNSQPPVFRLSLDKAAKSHRKAAAHSNPKYTWSGPLPPKTQKPIGYSSKVFVGGVPYDITESNLHFTFRNFGQIKVEWPDKDKEQAEPKGYCHVVFESEKQVKALLASCVRDYSNGGKYLYKITSKRIKGKQVEIIPWALNDSNYVKSSSQKLDPEKTVFVGALHGMMTATALATVMDSLFNNVIYAGIDTDKCKYPIGSARVTFLTKQSYNKAINAEFVEIRTPKFAKIIQLDPYIGDAPCSICFVQQGPYFCRESVCFKYYCHTCWLWVHSYESGMSWHDPMSRGMKSNQLIGLTPKGARL